MGRAGDLADRLVGEANSVSSKRIGSIDQMRSQATSTRSSSANRRELLGARKHRSELLGVEVTLVEQLLGRLHDQVTIPGRHTTPPEVQTAPSPVSRATSRIARASFAAPASASRRLSIGVEPACAACPVHVIRERSTPNVPRTTPSGRSSDSSTVLDVSSR